MAFSTRVTRSRLLGALGISSHESLHRLALGVVGDVRASKPRSPFAQRPRVQGPRWQNSGPCALLKKLRNPEPQRKLELFYDF